MFLFLRIYVKKPVERMKKSLGYMASGRAIDYIFLLKIVKRMPSLSLTRRTSCRRFQIFVGDM